MNMSNAIVGLSSMATRHILDELARRYKDANGTDVAIRAMGGVAPPRLVRAGEETDIVILAAKVMVQLEAEGLIVSGSIRGFARSGMAIAVRAGTAHPDVSDGEKVRRAVADAGKVAYSTGPSGDHLLKLCEGWGILPERLVKAPPGVPVGSLVARGEADLGFQQLSELIHEAGIDVVGPLPPEIQSETIFAAGVSTTSSQPRAVTDLIAYLASPPADEVKRAQGMEPAAG
jgi:molybdate transport system substrate-binding protein